MYAGCSRVISSGSDENRIADQHLGQLSSCDYGDVIRGRGVVRRRWRCPFPVEYFNEEFGSLDFYELYDSLRILICHKTVQSHLCREQPCDGYTNTKLESSAK